LLEYLWPLRLRLLPAVRLGLVALRLLYLLCLSRLLGKLCFIALRRFLSVWLYFIAALCLRLNCPSLAQLCLRLSYGLLGLAQPYLRLSYLHLLPCPRQL
jgi:hypothetical protein